MLNCSLKMPWRLLELEGTPIVKCRVSDFRLTDTQFQNRDVETNMKSVFLVADQSTHCWVEASMVADTCHLYFVPRTNAGL